MANPVVAMALVTEQPVVRAEVRRAVAVRLAVAAKAAVGGAEAAVTVGVPAAAQVVRTVEEEVMKVVAAMEVPWHGIVLAQSQGLALGHRQGHSMSNQSAPLA